MTKFNVGDSFKYISDIDKGFFTKNQDYEVLRVGSESVGLKDNHGKTHRISFDYLKEHFKFNNSKPTKNQRITALENEVAELKLIVHELRGKKATTTAEVIVDGMPVDIKNAPEIQMKAPLTPNQQRDAVIEKAKKFVEEQAGINLLVDTRDCEIQKCPSDVTIAEFQVDIENHKITALIKKGLFEIQKGAIAKCSPNDVFNEHIGKAISLGRALGLNVSEFEHAVQPNEAVTGMMIDSLYIGRECGDPLYKNTKVTGINKDGYPKHDGRFASRYKIINDTNADYKGEKE